jgi:hypothetical protein
MKKIFLQVFPLVVGILLLLAGCKSKLEKAVASIDSQFNVFLVFLILAGGNSLAQGSEENEEPFRSYHQLGLVLSHAHVFEGLDDNGKRGVLSLASWGIDYNFFFRPKWGIGVHTDLILEDFKVEKTFGNKESIERSYPVAPAVMGIYKPGEHWSFLLGMGGEFAREENFILTRLGIEYSVELSKGWEIAGCFGYDIKWDAYNTWTIGIGISKIL